ncbi:MAG: FKBP-type peptidyl-prolyl cis-trans isomerase [Patescibacteria group bacterium]|mgnify:CR=1 FL=1
MNIQTIIIGLVVIIVIAVGGYGVYRSKTPSATGSANPAAVTQTATSTEQVQGQDVKVGTGREAKPGDTVSVLYVGKFTDGTIFDSSAAHNNEPLKFVLGADGLIPGFQVGVNGMKEGGQRLLSIPPTLGYGTQDVKDASGKVIIPANSTLIFEVQLEKVEDTPAAPAPKN